MMQIMSNTTLTVLHQRRSAADGAQVAAPGAACDRQNSRTAKMPVTKGRK